ncbi:MAG: uroporphyrinogen decarboxylase family protein, partial [Gemmatimonadota bacterium]
TRWVEHDTGGYWDFCDFPLAEATVDEVARWPLPSPDDFDYGAIRRQAVGLRGYCLHAGGAGTGCVINRLAKLRGMEQILVDLATDDERGLLLMERKQSVELEIARRSLAAAGDAVDLLWMGEDLGTQIGPMISLELYRRHLRPWHQRFVDLAKAHDLKVVFHCCGSSSWAFADFIEMGIDAVETLQPEARDMAPAHLKATYGGRLAFHGCISTAGPVAHGTVEETIADCRRTLEVMMPGGGYCFAPTHLLQDDTPTENAVAMYEAARRFGQYG